MLHAIHLFLFLFTACNGYAAEKGIPPSFEKPAECLVPAEQAQLFCRSMGQGSPVIVVHGGPGLTQDYLLPQMYHLAEKHFVIFYDQRGCGKSVGEISPDTINIESFVRDLNAIRKAFGLSKVSILGHSWGGFLAMQYAIKHPDCVDKLILSNSMPASFEDCSLFVEEWKRRTASIREKLAEIRSSQAFQRGDPDATEQLYRLTFRTYCYRPEKANFLNLRMTPAAALNGAKVYQHLRENLLAKPFNLYQALQGLKIPTLVIHGDHDVVPFSTAKNIHDSLFDSCYVLMKQCGHFPYVENPEAYFHHLDAFLD